MKKSKGLLLTVMLPGLMAAPTLMAMDNIAISGVIEAEYGASTGYGDPVTGASGAKESGYSLATVELGIDARLNANVDGHILVLHEDGDTEPWEVDEGTVTLHAKDNLVFLTAGRMYVPFGHFDSNMVSDPMTLELGETREAAVMAGVEYKGINFSVFAFNGETIEDSDNVAGEKDDTSDQHGFSLSYTFESDKFNISAGYSCINSIAESGLVYDSLGNFYAGDPAEKEGELKDYVGGTSIYLTAAYGPVSFIAEKLSARDSFNVAELDFYAVGAPAAGAQPEASNIELAATFPVAGMEVTVGIAQQTTSEALALQLPEKSTLFTVSAGIYKNTTLSIESRTDTDYAVTDNATYDDGTGPALHTGTGDKAKTLTVQLAVVF